MRSCLLYQIHLKTAIDAIIEGDVDDFILAYLRDTEAQTAWE